MRQAERNTLTHNIPFAMGTEGPQSGIRVVGARVYVGVEPRGRLRIWRTGRP